jgi:hypothetical protein
VLHERRYLARFSDVVWIVRQPSRLGGKSCSPAIPRGRLGNRLPSCLSAADAASPRDLVKGGETDLAEAE